MQQLAATGANSVELTYIVGQASNTSSVVTATRLTESDSALLHAINEATSLGLTVNVKVQDLARGAMDPSNVAEWFATYTQEVVHAAQLAQEGGAQLFTIGTEMTSLSGPAYTSYWDTLIADVRQVYSGQLTYAAIGTEASQIQFWNKLDLIGDDAYFPVATRGRPLGAAGRQRLGAGGFQLGGERHVAGSISGKPVGPMGQTESSSPKSARPRPQGGVEQPGDIPNFVSPTSTSPGVDLQEQATYWQGTLQALQRVTRAVG